MNAFSQKWQKKEIRGLFFFRLEMLEELDPEEAKRVYDYFSTVLTSWQKCFSPKRPFMPLFRFMECEKDPTHLKICMLRTDRLDEEEVIIAEKVVIMTTVGLSLFVAA